MIDSECKTDLSDQWRDIVKLDCGLWTEIMMFYGLMVM